MTYNSLSFGTELYGNHGKHVYGKLNNDSVCPVDGDDDDAERMSTNYVVEVYDDVYSTFLIPCLVLFCYLLWLQYSKQMEKRADLKMALLYLQFHVCEEIYKKDARTKLLQEFVSTFVERTFDEFIDVIFSRDGINKTSKVEIKELDAELRKIRNSRFTHNRHCANLFKYTDRIRLERGQLMFRLAATFMSSNSKNTSMDPTHPDFETMHINHLNVPALLDIIINCSLFCRIGKHVEKIVDAYVNYVLGEKESDTGMDAAIGVCLDQIDDTLLPEKSRYQDNLNGIADLSRQNNEMDQDTTTTNVENCSSTAIPCAVVLRWNLFRGDDSSVSSDLDEDTNTNQMSRLLYLRFHVCENTYKNEERTKLLQEILSIFVKHRFQKFIDEKGIHEMSLDGIKQFDDELNKMRRSNFTPNTHWTSWFDYTDCKLLEKSQLIFCAAATFMSSNSENTTMDPANTDFKTMDINNLNIPALLDIISNCTLFESVREHVGTITDAFLSTGLKTKAIYDLLDDASFPEKAHYQAKVNQKKMDEEPAISKSLRDDPKNPLYLNWVKGTLTLKYLSEGVKIYILAIFIKFKTDLNDGGSHFDDGEELKKLGEQVEFSEFKWQCNSTFKCIECSTLFKKVVLQYRKKRLNSKAGLDNCKDIPAGGAWGIAKMYMPGSCKSLTKPEEADAQSLLHLILNCKLFSHRKDHIRKIIDMRNKLMHSPDLTISQDDLTTLTVSELVFLKEAIESKELEDEAVYELKASKKKINEIIASEMNIDYGKAAVEYQQEEMTKELNQENSLANKEQQNKLESIQKLHYEFEIKRLNQIITKMNKKFMEIERRRSWLSS